MNSIKIGNIVVKKPIFLAPMVEVTDLAYRDICRENGASVTYTEMIHVNALIHENEPTKALIKTNNKDHPTGIQITGSELKDYEKVIPILKKYDFVDINCGCPSTRISDNEAGSALLKDPKKIGKIIRLLKKNGLIVTAKIRLGFNKNNVIETVKEIEKAGASLITVHARLANQRSSVPADWKWIEKVKKTVSIPVIGNGDIFSGKDVERMLKICDGCMVARGAIGNPTIFKQINHYLETGEEIPFNFKDNIKYLLKYLELVKKYKIINLGRIKYIGSNFITKTKGAAKMRNEFMQCKSYEECLDFVKKLVNS